MPIDYEHELGNGWNPWQTIVLEGMKEIRDDLKGVHAEVTAQGTRQALLVQTVEGMADFSGRLKVLEDERIENQAIRRQNKILISAMFGILSAIAIPVAGILLTSSGLF